MAAAAMKRTLSEIVGRVGGGGEIVARSWRGKSAVRQGLFAPWVCALARHYTESAKMTRCATSGEDLVTIGGSRKQSDNDDRWIRRSYAWERSWRGAYKHPDSSRYQTWTECSVVNIAPMVAVQSTHPRRAPSLGSTLSKLGRGRKNTIAGEKGRRTGEGVSLLASGSPGRLRSRNCPTKRVGSSQGWHS